MSALAAGPLAARFGLIRTMVYTHLPSNVLLILVPFMPTLELRRVLLFIRFSISQMDVPTRQSYTMAVVEPDERSAAAGVTGIARSLGVALSPLIAGPLYLGASFTGAPFVIGGSIKIVYDLLLYRAFSTRAAARGAPSRKPLMRQCPRRSTRGHRPHRAHARRLIGRLSEGRLRAGGLNRAARRSARPPPGCRRRACP